MEYIEIITTYIKEHANAGVFSITLITIVSLQLIMIYRRGGSRSSYRLVSITIISFVGLLAALTVSNQHNASGIFGLLGTIVGYLIGKSKQDTITT